MLESYRNEYVAFIEAESREYYLFLSGQKSELDLAPIYERYSDLFSQDAIERLARLHDETSPHFETERTSLRHLQLFATEQYLADAGRELTEAISRHDAGDQVTYRGEPLSLQSALVALKTEPDAETRREIYDRRASLIAAANDLRMERITKLHEAARRLGHASYMALYETLLGIDYGALSRQCEAILATTDSLYLSRLDGALRRSLGMRVEEATRADYAFFLNLTGYDERFPGEELLRVYRETLAGLGINTEKQPNILIDSEPRPRKSPRAYCVAVRVPEEIRLILRPIGGQADYQALLHEGGHAQHFAWVSPSLRPELRTTGDYALTESYAFLFNHLIYDPDWLLDIFGWRESGEFIGAVKLGRLAQIRRYAARLIYECELHAGEDFGRAAARYAELQTDATKFQTSEVEFLYDLDDAFYSANHVRAWSFEVILREHLKTRFGTRWWRSRRAGNLLKEIWETGFRYSADDMASQLSIGPITPEALIEEYMK